MIVLDTPVLSLAFRRRREDAAEPAESLELRRLLRAGAPLRVPGVVMQEFLSGVRSEEEYARLHRAVEGYDVVLATATDHYRAAEIRNQARRHGIAASTIDCLIAAQTLHLSAELFTTDADFVRLAPLCRLRLYSLGR